MPSLRLPLAVAAVAVAALVVALALSARDDERPAAPAGTARDAPSRTGVGNAGAPLSRSPTILAGDVANTRASLWEAIDRWRSVGDPTRGGPPADVALLALRQQRIYRLLGRSPRLSSAVLARLPARLRAEVRDNVLAHRELGRIVSVHRGPPPRIAIGPAEPAGVLRDHYGKARLRFGVSPALLAAVNFVESAFGRLRNRSVSGARGPMQFMPATWRAYGLGGDVQDPHDAILGAANYLHANGAATSERAALHHYNPSWAYVSAVERYAKRMRADAHAFYAYYSWAVFAGSRRLTGPGV